MRILFVCIGNICRSPIAEGVLRSMIRRENLNWTIASAGTEHYHIGEAPHVFSQNVCRRNQIDISGQRARHFSLSDLDHYDKIYAMSVDVLDRIAFMSADRFDPLKISLFLNELYPASNRSVPDPWYGPEEGYDDVYRMIEKTCKAIVQKYRHTYIG